MERYVDHAPVAQALSFISAAQPRPDISNHGNQSGWVSERIGLQELQSRRLSQEYAKCSARLQRKARPQKGRKQRTCLSEQTLKLGLNAFCPGIPTDSS